MHTTKRYELPEGIIYYNDYADNTGRADNGICITAYEGNAEQLLVPECIDNYPVYDVRRIACARRRLEVSWLSRMIGTKGLRSCT